MDRQRQIEIEGAGEAELPRVQALARVIWPECFAGLLPAEGIDRMVEEIYHLDTLRADLRERSHRFWIARVGGEDAGYASAYQAGTRLWIKKLYVRDACRGLGLGKRLIVQAHAALPQVDTISLYVYQHNLRAIAFYRAQGFSVESLVPVRMGPLDLHDYVMTRPALA